MQQDNKMEEEKWAVNALNELKHDSEKKENESGKKKKSIKDNRVSNSKQLNEMKRIIIIITHSYLL